MTSLGELGQPNN